MQATAKLQAANLEAIKSAIAAKMDSASYTSWISPVKFDVANNVLSLIAPNQFSADFITSVYTNILEDVASNFGLSLYVGTCATTQTKSTTANDNTIQKFTPAPVAIAPTQNVAFDNFIPSDENAFVLSACKKLASGSASFSPLFIYGATGSGKSLLADCINSSANGRTLKMTGSQFVSEFSRSLREHSNFAFKDFCRNCDTFIMDDVHVLAGKKATSEEFMQLLMDLHGAGKNIVLTANAAPASLGGFDRRLLSLFASGLVADVAAPTSHVKKTMLMRAGVASDVAQMLSSRIGSDGHLINGVAKKIQTYVELMDEKVTPAVAEKLLSDSIAKNKTPIAMVKTMCEQLGVSYDEICGRGRARTIVRARQIMMSALKVATNMSLTEIGRVVGDRDHATVLYAISQIDIAKSSDLILSAEIDQMIELCR